MIYSLSEEYGKTVMGIIITKILLYIVDQVIKVPEKYEKKFNEKLKPKNVDTALFG